jgi:hypothetical protein
MIATLAFPTDTAAMISDDQGRNQSSCWKLKYSSIHEQMQMLSATMIPKNCEALLDWCHGGCIHCSKTVKDCKKVRDNKTLEDTAHRFSDLSTC